MPIDLRTLPKFRDGLSFIYLEHCKIEQNDKSIAIFNKEGKTPIPCANLALIMLGPGTSISHAAIMILIQTGCTILWVGEQGVRLYAQGLGETRSARNILLQAHLITNVHLRLQIVQRLYIMRFKETIDQNLTIAQLRGLEGVRVRKAYQDASKEFNVPWTGRKYKPSQWTQSDPVNRALSTANSCLYGLCHAAILSAGYSPALGFIHTGQQLSFVYDIADLYKVDLIIPLAFQIIHDSTENIEHRTRVSCRDLFYQSNLLTRIIPDIQSLFDIKIDSLEKILAQESLFDAEALDTGIAQPSDLWNPGGTNDPGGKNYDIDA